MALYASIPTRNLKLDLDDAEWVEKALTAQLMQDPHSRSRAFHHEVLLNVEKIVKQLKEESGQ